MIDYFGSNSPKEHSLQVGFAVLTAVGTKMAVFLVVANYTVLQPRRQPSPFPTNLAGTSQYTLYMKDMVGEEQTKIVMAIVNGVIF
jgi:hypothetical protein